MSIENIIHVFSLYSWNASYFKDEYTYVSSLNYLHLMPQRSMMMVLITVLVMIMKVMTEMLVMMMVILTKLMMMIYFTLIICMSVCLWISTRECKCPPNPEKYIRFPRVISCLM